LFFYPSRDHRHLHSFPTRRSSDLFRGYLQFTAAEGMGFWPAAILLSLIFAAVHLRNPGEGWRGTPDLFLIALFFCLTLRRTGDRSEEHTSELQSLTNLVCRLLLEK